MTRCRRAGVMAPCIYSIDTSLHTIYMEFIQGPTLKAVVQSEGPCRNLN